MGSRDFCFWLQGYFEIQGDPKAMSKEQVAVVQNHLALVFKHEIDPSIGPPAHQVELNAVHAGQQSTGESSPKIGGTDPVSGATMRC